MEQALIVLMAYTIDRMAGDPRSIPHPVVYMGKAIKWLEGRIRLFASGEKQLRLAGVLLPLILAGGSCLGVWLMLKGLAWLHPWLSRAAEIWLISTTIATKGLADAGMEIHSSLSKGRIREARQSLSMVVGRDTERLDPPEIARGAVETVAENIVDAIISPLFYAAIGGAPLAMAYRAANTLDSMVGYRNERYLNLGWASARLDDLANLIPARIAAALLVIACWMKGLDWRGCWRVIRRDARLHPSPNSGFTEAGVAGGLGIRLGGLNHYQGVPSQRAKLGDALRPIDPDDIKETVSLMNMVSVLFLALCLIGLLCAFMVDEGVKRGWILCC